MSGHAPHHRQPGYSPDQLLVTGCPECAYRAADIPSLIDNLTPDEFGRAMTRADAWFRGLLPDAAAAETGLFRVLAAVQRQQAVAAARSAIAAAALNPA